MKVGKLRHRVTLQGRTETQDGDTGAITQGWAPVATVWASVEPLSAREFIASQATQAKVTARVTIRYRDDVVPTMRLVHLKMGAEVVYNVEGVLSDRESGVEYLTLVVSSGDNESGA
ncbi:MAG: head-tail adaptor protein [Ramlibacter sp.]|jgi:SPP1 family predicted phage head-tail adaptor|nr:head-tail adaptor protein [Ramlibacter sp.]